MELRGRHRTSPSTWWSSPPESDPATSWPVMPGCRWASAAASWSTRRAGPDDGRVRGRRGGLHRRPHLGPGRRRATRWPRSSWTGCSAATRPSRAPTSRPSSSFSGSTWPASATPSRESPGALEVVYADPVAGVYKKLVMSDDAQTLLGGVLVGDASAYAALRPLVGAQLGADPTSWLLPEGAAAPPDGRAARRGQRLLLQQRRRAGTIRVCGHRAAAAPTWPAVKACTKAGTRAAPACRW